jgi:hypothetical protein
MSVTVMAWAWKQDLTSTEKIVLVALADRADDDGLCWPGHKSLSTKCGLNRRTIVRVVDRLANKGLISIERRHREDGSLMSNRYVLHVNDMVQGDEAPPRDRGSPPSDTVSPPPSDTESHHDTSVFDTSVDPPPKNAPPVVSKPKKERTHATKLSETWRPDEQNCQYARTLGFSDEQIAGLADDFREHFANGNGRDKTRLSWRQTWQTWCRRDIEWHGEPGSRRNGSRVSSRRSSGAGVFAEVACEVAASLQGHGDGDSPVRGDGEFGGGDGDIDGGNGSNGGDGTITAPYEVIDVDEGSSGGKGRLETEGNGVHGEVISISSRHRGPGVG